MGEVTGPTAGAEELRRVAPLPAWVLAGLAVAVAVAVVITVPGEVSMLGGTPRTVAWASAVFVAVGLAFGDQRLAPFAVTTLTLSAAVALVVDEGPVGLAAIGVGIGGWLCLELTASSLEARTRCRRSAATVARRIGDLGIVTLASAAIAFVTLTVATDVDASAVVLQGIAVVIAVAVIGLIGWLARGAVRH